MDCSNIFSEKYWRILGPKLSRPPRVPDYWNYTVLFFFPTQTYSFRIIKFVLPFVILFYCTHKFYQKFNQQGTNL